LSFILLTHATTAHIGAFAHCCKHFPLFTQIPVYATNPVIAFGRTLLQDLYSSQPLAATFITPSGPETEAETLSANDTPRTNILAQAPTLEEIAKYFSLIIPLKYSQPHQPSASQFAPPLEGLTVTAFNSGHTVGGTIWHIQHGMESIVYAVDWNQVRENVIGGAAWFGGIGGSEVIEQLRRPTALVCSSKGGDTVALSGGRKKRDDLLLDHIRSSVAKGGSVLVPVDSSARVLEIAWLLEKSWQDASTNQTLKNAKIFLASKCAIATMRHARSLLEWMDDSIVREFEGDDDNISKTHKRTGSKQVNGQASKPARPFEFKHIKMVERRSQFEKALKSEGPRIILASDLSLDWGYSKEVLQEISHNPENLIILTEKLDSVSKPHETVGYALWKWFKERQDGVALERTAEGEQLEQVHSGGRALKIPKIVRSPLEGKEMQLYQQYMATQKQLQSSFLPRTEAGSDDEGAAEEDDSDSSSSEDSEDEGQGRVLNVSAALGHAGRKKAAISDEDLGVTILLRKKGVYDFDVRNKKGRNAVFPYAHTRKRGDDYGEYIRPEDYLRAEEKEEPDALQGDKSNIALGQKRKWGYGRNGVTDGTNKRQQVKRAAEAAAGKAHDGVNGPEDVHEADDSDQSDSEPEEDSIQGPSKAILTTHTVNVNARLAFVDFTGIHDRRSLQILIPLISPRKLILVAGTKDETETLAADCKSLLAVKEGDVDSNSVVDIFTPTLKQTVDASVDTNAWIVKLSRNLVKRLQWQSVRAMNVVTLTAQLRGEAPAVEDAPTNPSNKKQKLLKEDSETKHELPTTVESRDGITPILDVLPTNMAAVSRSNAQSLHVGDMRLTDLRRLMVATGHSAEFRGEGTLVIDGNIAVKKLGTGKIVVESATANTIMTSNRGKSNLQEVKRQIYAGLAVVAGS
jgi:cleavage and polyadenylation specificity factor subunit 2